MYIAPYSLQRKLRKIVSQNKHSTVAANTRKVSSEVSKNRKAEQ